MNDTPKRDVAIIGGGPAGLMAAEVLSENPCFRVTVYDAMPTVGRKFLMAGRGGLNLTHTEPRDAFVGRYSERSDLLRSVIESWSPADVQAWCEGLGQETYVGSSGRVFPKNMKASGLLRSWLRRLEGQGVEFAMRHRWTGWDDDGQLSFDTRSGNLKVAAHATVLALGGASWSRLGSDGGWVAILEQAGVEVAPLLPANCGFYVGWSDVFRARFEGQPLKSIAVGYTGHEGGRAVRGEAMISSRGIEGGAIYAVSAPLRAAILADGRSSLMIDLKPDVDQPVLAEQLARPRAKQSMSTYLRKAARLSPVAIGLLQEMAIKAGAPLGALTPAELATAIKSVTLPVIGMDAIDKAISSAGGIVFEELDAGFMLTKRPGVFVAGEMIDWEAPTGGYLLQACFATGRAAGLGAQEWLGVDKPTTAGMG